MFLNGVTTYPDAKAVRVCVRLGSRANNKPRQSSSSKKPICAIGRNNSRRSSCRDACQCACKALLQPSRSMAPWHWISLLFQRASCADLCIPACAQPNRVARSEFSGPI